jgi:hypothetical protein
MISDTYFLCTLNTIHTYISKFDPATWITENKCSSNNTTREYNLSVTR